MRVKLKTKNKGIKVETYPCRKCSEPIKPGEQYYEWKHRHCSPSRQHQSHGSPKQSELCTGKMSGVYAATENVETAISDAQTRNDASGLSDALNEAAESVREVANEYEENRSNMPESLQDGNVGSDMEEKANALNEFADALESAASDSEITDWEMDEESPEPGEDHTAECATNKTAKPDAGSADDNGGEGESTEEKCDCGYDELQEQKDAWQQELEDKVQAACDRAQSALDELSV